MKFWNKQPAIRRKYWTKVTLISHPPSIRIPRPSTMWNKWGGFSKLKSQLQNSESTGKFYMDAMIREVWFEHREDAIWFTLSYE